MTDLTIHPRSSWNPEPRGGNVIEREPSSIHELFIHWPGGEPASWQRVNSTDEDRAAIRGIQGFHIHHNHWSDIGYNFVLCPNWGRRSKAPAIYTARGAHYIPAAQLNHNTGTLAILVLMGPSDPLLDSVLRRLRSFHKWANDYAGRDLVVRPHGAVTGTECPGPKLRAAIARGLR